MFGRPIKRVALLLTWLLLLATAQALAGAQTAGEASLSYYGGPVVHSANAVVVNWGPNINPIYTDETGGDPGLIKYLASQNGSTGDIGAVLAQYMDTSGQNSANRVSYGGQYVITPSIPSTSITDGQVQNELISQIGAGHLPRPAGNGLSTIYLINFPASVSVCFSQNDCSGTTFCAYHANARLPDNTPVLYAVLPSDEPGTASFSGCGNASTFFQNQTGYLSHEWAETINDPLVVETPSGGLGAPLGWYWYQDNQHQGEIADICDAVPLSSNGPWTVESLWSNRDVACESGESGSPTFAPPTASFSPPGAALTGQALAFDGSGSSDRSSNQTSATNVAGGNQTYSIGSGIASYDWSWGDGTPDGSGASPTHAYGTAGSYNVTLTVTDNMGFTASTTQAVSVAAPPPAVGTGAADGISAQGATLHGTINPFGQTVSYQFAYGTSSSALTSLTTAAAGPAGSVATPVSATVSGLAPSTTYYYRLQVTLHRHTYSGQLHSFRTNTAPVRQRTPVVGTGGATGIGTDRATLNGTVNPRGPAAVAYRFSYGSSPGHLDRRTAQATVAGAAHAIPVRGSIAGLRPRTTYYFRLDASVGGRTYSGHLRSFATRARAPSVRTGTAHVHGVTARLLGTIGRHGFQTRYYFQLGANSSATLTARAATVSAVVPGLQPHTTYRYRLVAISAGGTVLGAERTFTTGAAPAPAPRISLGVDRGQTLAQALGHGLRVRLTCLSACSASATATRALGGLARFAAQPVTVARGSARLRHSGVVTLYFTRFAQSSLARATSLKLIVSAVAAGKGAAPAALSVTLAR